MRNTRSLILSLVLALGTSVSSQAWDGASDPLRFDGGPSPSIARPLPSAAELRQRRALEFQRQRDLRTHANAWAGHDPLRPMVPANPYTQLRYPVYRPTHIWSVWDYVGRPY